MRLRHTVLPLLCAMLFMTATGSASAATLPPPPALISLPDDGNPATTDDAAVYLYDTDGKRHAFPNEAIFKTWYTDFSSVTEVSRETLASIPLGKNVTYRAGTRLVKLQTDPKVYAVESGNKLRWITSESIATTLYGATWALRVDDMPDVFFADYAYGNPIETPTYPDGTVIVAQDGSRYVIEDGVKRPLSNATGDKTAIQDSFVIHEATKKQPDSTPVVVKETKTPTPAPSPSPTPKTPPPPEEPPQTEPTEPTEPVDPAEEEEPNAPVDDTSVILPSSLYPVTGIPTELSTFAFPAQPVTTRTVTVTDAATFTAEAAINGTHIIVGAPITASVAIDASDIRVTMEPGARLGELTIRSSAKQNKRISLEGGTYRNIHLFQAVGYWPDLVTYPDRMLEDITIDGVTVGDPSDANLGNAIWLTGHRVAVVRSTCRAVKYCIWSDDGSSNDPALQNSDILIAGNDFRTEGLEANIRLVHANRAIVVDNLLQSDLKHNFRIHGTSDLVFVADNTLLDAGIMTGAVNDVLGALWFVRNTIYNTLPDMFNMANVNMDALYVLDNVAYSDTWTCFYCSPTHAPISSIERNVIHPYQLP